MHKIFLIVFALLLNSAQAMQNPFEDSKPLEQQLMQAIARDDAGKVAYLLREKRLDPNFYLPNGETPLVWALKNDAKVTAEKVLINSVKLKVNMPTLRGETPLMLAAIKGNIDFAKVLLAKGADINANYGWTALHYSASTGQTAMTRFLIDNGAAVNARTERGVTPLYMAARIVATPTVDALLEAGADKTLCNDQGISPSAIALKRGDEKLAQKLAIEACSPWPNASKATEVQKIPESKLKVTQ